MVKADLRLAANALKNSTFVAGVVKYHDKPNQLLLDWDSKPPTVPELLKMLRELQLTPVSISYQRSTRNWHGVIELTENFSYPVRVFFQLYCKSDRQRERWGMIRFVHFRNRSKYVQVLFSEKINVHRPTQ